MSGRTPYGLAGQHLSLLPLTSSDLRQCSLCQHVSSVFINTIWLIQLSLTSASQVNGQYHGYDTSPAAEPWSCIPRRPHIPSALSSRRSLLLVAAYSCSGNLLVHYLFCQNILRSRFCSSTRIVHAQCARAAHLLACLHTLIHAQAEQCSSASHTTVLFSLPPSLLISSRASLSSLSHLQCARSHRHSSLLSEFPSVLSLLSHSL